MNDVEIQAKATIAAALITTGTFKLSEAAEHKQNPEAYPEVDLLTAAVDEIYRVLVNPR